MVVKTDGYLAHYGVAIDNGAPGRGSGRYPKGSGERPNQHGILSIFKKKDKALQNKKSNLEDQVKDIISGTDLAKLEEYNTKANEAADKLAKEYDEYYKSLANNEEFKGKVWDTLHDDLGVGTDDSELYDLVVMEAVDKAIADMTPKSLTDTYDAVRDNIKGYFDEVDAMEQKILSQYPEDAMLADKNGNKWPAKMAVRLAFADNVDGLSWNAYMSRHLDDYWVYDMESRDALLNEFPESEYNKKYSNVHHSGVGHDENPPGRGSGRYPFGSGERPAQHVSASVRAKLLKAHDNAVESRKLRKAKRDEKGSAQIMEAVLAGDNDKVKALVAKYGKEAVSKKAVLKSEDPEFVYENRKKLSSKELEAVMARINKEAELKQMIDSQKSTASPEEVQKDTKESIIKSGNAQKVLRYKDQLTDEELQAAYNRIQKIQNLQNAAMANVKKSDPTLFERGAKLIANAVIDAAAKQATAAIQGGIAYGGQKLMNEILQNNKELQSYVVGSMKGSGKKKNKGKNNNNNDND